MNPEPQCKHVKNHSSNRWRRLVLCLLFICSIFQATVIAQQRNSPQAILRQAELKRKPWPTMTLSANLRDSGTAGVTETDYQIFLEETKALVASSGPRTESGKLLLLESNDMWVYFPGTSNPIKITPLQRLSGSVSLVDITKLNWSTDYHIDSFQTVSIGNLNETESYLLTMQAVSDQIPYQKINLWIGKKDFHPLKADVYLASGKLFKSLVFEGFAVVAGKEICTVIEYIDHFNKGRKSVIKFSRIKEFKNIPENYFLKDNLRALSGKLDLTK